MYQRTRVFRIFRTVGIVVLLFWAAFPVFFMFLSTFKMPKEIFKFPPSLIFKPTLKNFVDLVKDWPIFFKSLGHSAVVAFGASLLAVLLAAPAGYALSRYRNRFLEGSAFFMLAVRMYPPIVLTVPLFPALSAAGLVDTFWVLILLYCTFFISLSSWLMKTYMDEVPIELEEAAAIDGASVFQRVIHVVIPLSIHGIIATAIFVTIFAWKEYMVAYIFTGTNIRTSPLVLYEMLSPVTGVSWGPLFAASTIQLMPILAFIWMVQSYLVQGMKTGGVKG
ncbi:MAG TPA: carbohydrate ABC transporter permease [Spirochaetia bacterium]|nr:carbohydrate ABC transporter permease [Spirochaetia bacterium]